MSPTKLDIITFVEKLDNILNTIKNRKNHSLEKKFISNAEKDLESCRILYRKGVYSLALYHLQQAIEKTTKAWVLYLGVISEDELRKIGHKTPRAFLKLLDQSEIGKMTYSLVQISNVKIPKDTTRFRNLVESEGVDVARMDYKSIKMLLDVLHQMDKRAAKLLKPYKKVFNILNLDLAGLHDIPIAFTSLYLISGLTFPHYEFTRYPGLAVEPSEYTKDLGIVKALPELITITKKCIDTVSKFISM